MSTFKSFEDIEAWKNARVFANKIYKFTLQGSFSTDFKLRDQINGASGSVMDNIAEGFERDGVKEFIYFLSISKGSVGEVRYQLYRAFDRNHISQDVFHELKDEALVIGRQLSKLMKYLRSTGWRGSKFVNEPGESYSNQNL